MARRRGASQRSVLLLLPLSFFCLIGSTWQVRTQSLAYLLFVACLWLLVEDAQAAVVAGVLVPAAARRLGQPARLGDARRGPRRAAWDWTGPRRDAGARGSALAALAPAMLFVSPYGASLVGYYHSTLFNPAFSSMLNEWQPPKFGVMTAPFFALAIGVAWLCGRSRNGADPLRADRARS